MTWMTWIEIAATLFGLVSVWFTVRQNIWCWPTGIAMVTLYIFVFHDAKLYADMSLQVVFIAMQIYGWHHWLHGGRKQGPLLVGTLTAVARMVWSMVAVLATALVGWLLHSYTDASLPYGDATITVLSLIAQWLMARKKLENWVLWIAVNIVSIGIYYIKTLYWTSGLYLVFLIMATLGLIAWRRHGQIVRRDAPDLN